MNSKNARIIQRLVKIAKNQQEILKRLAQAAQGTPEDQDYLIRAAKVAAMNSGLNASNFTVVYNQPSGPTTPGTTPSGGWTVTLTGAAKDNSLRQKYIETLKAQVAAQKPAFPPVSIVFAD